MIDAHEKAIQELKNRAPVEMPEIKGDGLDMGQLMNMFASKNPPENTIKRIEDLEKMMKDALAQLADLASRPSGQPTAPIAPTAPTVVASSGLDADSM